MSLTTFTLVEDGQTAQTNSFNLQITICQKSKLKKKVSLFQAKDTQIAESFSTLKEQTKISL